MKVGTPGFVGARLREARQARGVAAVALSEMIGVSRQAISQYENGNVTPHPDTLLKISQVLNLPPMFFQRPMPTIPRGTVFFRSMSAATQMARDRGEARLDWLWEIVDYLQQYVVLPSVSFPDLDLPGSHIDLTPELIEEATTEVRRQWGLGSGPIANMMRTVEKNGAVVARTALYADTLDALSDWTGDRPYVLVGTEKDSAVRARFDIAHEIGHLILHRRVDQRALRSSPEFKLLEQQAHAFAGALLLPAEEFTRDLGRTPTLNAMYSLKSRWLTSIGAMIIRAHSLGLIDDEQTKRLQAQHAARGWKRREPLDDQLPTEQPRLLKMAFDLVLGTLSKEEVRASLPYGQVDVAELAGLPIGYLDDDPQVQLSRKVVKFPSDRTRQ